MEDFLKKGATKHCCYGLCNSDSRYGYRDYIEGVVFIRFPKPWRDKGKFIRWVNACKREGFTIDNVKKDTYICSKHFVGGKCPTEEHPDPIPVIDITKDVETQEKKRKSHTPCHSHQSKKGRKCLRADKKEENAGNATTETSLHTNCSDFSSNNINISVQVNPDTKNAFVQTESHFNVDPSLLAIWIENYFLKKENALLKSELDLLKCKVKEQQSIITDKLVSGQNMSIYMDMPNVKQKPE